MINNLFFTILLVLVFACSSQPPQQAPRQMNSDRATLDQSGNDQQRKRVAVTTSDSESQNNNQQYQVPYGNYAPARNIYTQQQTQGTNPLSNSNSSLDLEETATEPAEEEEQSNSTGRSSQDDCDEEGLGLFETHESRCVSEEETECEANKGRWLVSKNRCQSKEEFDCILIDAVWHEETQICIVDKVSCITAEQKWVDGACISPEQAKCQLKTDKAWYGGECLAVNHAECLKQDGIWDTLGLRCKSQQETQCTEDPATKWLMEQEMCVSNEEAECLDKSGVWQAVDKRCKSPAEIKCEEDFGKFVLNEEDGFTGECIESKSQCLADGNKWYQDKCMDIKQYLCLFNTSGDKHWVDGKCKTTDEIKCENDGMSWLYDSCVSQKVYDDAKACEAADGKWLDGICKPKGQLRCEAERGRWENEKCITATQLSCRQANGTWLSDEDRCRSRNEKKCLDSNGKYSNNRCVCTEPLHTVSGACVKKPIYTSGARWKEAKKWGRYSQCDYKKGEIAVGMCSSGRGSDCGPNDKFFQEIRCAKINHGIYKNKAINPSPKLSANSWGPNTTCGSNQVMVGFCSSGGGKDCDKRVHAILCKDLNPKYKLVGCYWHLSGKHYTDELYGSSGEVMVGICAGGGNADCNGRYKRARFCRIEVK